MTKMLMPLVVVAVVHVQALLSSEQLRVQGVQSDLAARTAKLSALEQQVDSLNTEVTEWRSRWVGRRGGRMRWHPVLCRQFHVSTCALEGADGAGKDFDCDSM